MGKDCFRLTNNNNDYCVITLPVGRVPWPEGEHQGEEGRVRLQTAFPQVPISVRYPDEGDLAPLAGTSDRRY